MAPAGGLADLVGALGHLVRREEDHRRAPTPVQGVKGGRNVPLGGGRHPQVEGRTPAQARRPPGSPVPRGCCRRWWEAWWCRPTGESDILAPPAVVAAVGGALSWA